MQTPQIAAFAFRLLSIPVSSFSILFPSLFLSKFSQIAIFFFVPAQKV